METMELFRIKDLNTGLYFVWNFSNNHFTTSDKASVFKKIEDAQFYIPYAMRLSSDISLVSDKQLTQ